MITAIVLTHNNQDQLSRTLTSLSWCDQLIVMDDYSTDRTVEISKQFGAQIISSKLAGDFSQQRNAALAKAKHKWVLFVDSDEVVSESLAKEIQHSIQATDVNGYYLRRRDWFNNKQLKYGETAAVRLLRLARSDAGLWQGSVHETWKVTGKIGDLKEALDHFPHPSLAEFLTDINVYSSLVAKARVEQGVRVHIWQVVVYPLGKFLHNYFWRQGFRDGMPGALMAIMMSFHSFLVRAKIYHLTDTRAIDFDSL